LALSGHTDTICYLSAFGVKRTYMGVWLLRRQSQLTQSGHSVSHVLRSSSAFAQGACMVRGLNSGQSCTDAP